MKPAQIQRTAYRGADFAFYTAYDDGLSPIDLTEYDEIILTLYNPNSKKEEARFALTDPEADGQVLISGEDSEVMTAALDKSQTSNLKFSYYPYDVLFIKGEADMVYEKGRVTMTDAFTDGPVTSSASITIDSETLEASASGASAHVAAGIATEAKADSEAALQNLLNSGLVKADFISTTTGDPNPTGAVEGSKGLRRKNDGDFELIEYDGEDWQPTDGVFASVQRLNEIEDKQNLRADISPGDGGKIERVKADGSRWEMTDSPKFKATSANDDFIKEALTSGGGLRLGQRTSRPIVSFIDDDGMETVLTKIKPLFDTKGIKGGLAIPTDRINSTLSLSEIKNLHSEGWEILSHLTSNDNISEVDDADTELRVSRTTWEDEGIPVYNYVPVQGVMGTAQQQRLIRKYYRAAFRTFGEINTPPFTQYPVLRVNVVTTSDPQPTLAELKGFVDRAISKNGWVVFTTHSNYSTFDSNREQVLSDLIDYIQSEGVDIVTPNEALDSFGNLFESGIKGGGWFSIDNEGKPHIDDLAIENLEPDFVGENGTNTFDTPAGDYPDNKISVTKVNNNITGSPAYSTANQRGTLLTYKFNEGDSSQAWSYQEFHTIRLNSAYRRYLNTSTGEWSKWELVGAMLGLGGDWVGPNGTNVNDTPMEDYPHGSISVTSVWDKEAGLPDDGEGTLFTYKLLEEYNSDEDFLVHQRFHPIRGNKIYGRYYDNATGGWSDPWEKVAGPPEGGGTTSRPSAPHDYQQYFDTDLGKPVWYDGANWVDATGTTV